MLIYFHIYVLSIVPPPHAPCSKTVARMFDKSTFSVYTIRSVSYETMSIFLGLHNVLCFPTITNYCPCVIFYAFIMICLLVIP